ncbi:hypothetical protein GCM10007301_31910 [Azorhizobium oxalatiphilum]|uniref:DUF3300 domain-containing protein n=1 Tax=Azorhizobium oxalatiphilum TaxID=980631 RepID=A0A917FCB6_9HYPH|nr:DUF3300 domain-containing protein [Azorhizobium oxalatiphilum]GGF69820.1 hypothetical protein GCM10007301_31910 [Azorhizobium oxalatiphilum]
MRRRALVRVTQCLCALALVAVVTGAHAQSSGDAAKPASASGTAEAASSFTAEELRKLLAPYALYPDELLAQLLPACAYPVEVVQVARWLEKNRQAASEGNFAALDAQGWDPSVKALARFPDVISKLNDNLDATSDIGDAFVHQPKDVADTIQRLRQQARGSGSLETTQQQIVTVEKQGDTDYVVIESAQPGVVYVPTYDPEVVYAPPATNWGAGALAFGTGILVGAALDNAWDWGRGWVYPPRWPGYPGYRPGYPGYPGGRPSGINIGNDINIGNGNNRPWRPDASRYRPGQGTKPGLAGPGLAGRGPGGPGPARPGIGPGRDGIGPSSPQQRPGAGSPRAGVADRAQAGRPNAGARPPRQNVSRPNAGAPRNIQHAPRPAQPRATAFSGARSGPAAAQFSNRGHMSRQSISRPPSGMGHGGGMGRGGGGGRRR